MKLVHVLLLIVGAALCVALGRWTKSSDQQTATAPTATAASDWTCPMHSQVRLPEAGACPICGMDLVSAQKATSASAARLTLTPAAAELARIETQPVERRFPSRPVRMVGKIDYDETAVRTISAWVGGRLERLFVDYTGVRVAEGDHLVRLYSPELSTAQEELLSARKRVDQAANSQSEFLAESSQRAYEAAREKLLLFGLTEEQVDEVEVRGTADDHVMLTSPASGVVIEKKLEQGAYVETGTDIYKIADLSHLWVRLDAYEQDLVWLRYGQDVSVEAEALPGETFTGRISFISPTIDERTRTVGVRVNVDNADGRLKPGMFVRAVATARVGADGVALDDYLAGKWVSPMHPEVVKDGPGACDVCGMDLERAEDLGLVAGEDSVAPLVVPRSAVLPTGSRAVVYVALPDQPQPTYVGRSITLGPRAGDWYIVKSGLSEGEEVVVHGAFRIDSAMQIEARPSMLSQPATSRSLDPALAQQLRPVLGAYLAWHRALAADDEGAARAAESKLRAAFEAADAATLGGHAREHWSSVRAVALDASGTQESTLEAMRVRFEVISNALIELLREHGVPDDLALARAHCPMAFDGAGASWLQADDVLANPYYGAAMLRCGTLEALQAK